MTWTWEVRMVPQTLVVIDLQVFNPQPVATLCLSFSRENGHPGCENECSSQYAPVSTLQEINNIPPGEKENHLQNAILGGYVSFLEGINLGPCDAKTTLVMGWDSPFQPSAPWMFLSLYQLLFHANTNWSVVSTPLKNIGQHGNLPPGRGWK